MGPFADHAHSDHATRRGLQAEGESGVLRGEAEALGRELERVRGELADQELKGGALFSEASRLQEEAAALRLELKGVKGELKQARSTSSAAMLQQQLQQQLQQAEQQRDDETKKQRQLYAEAEVLVAAVTPSHN